MLAGTLAGETRRKAHEEAHKLAGSVGTFGYLEASRLARAVEELFESAGPISQPDAIRVSNLVGALRRELEQPPPEDSGGP